MKLVFHMVFVASVLGLMSNANALQMSWNDNWDQTNWQRGGDYRYLDMDGDGTLNLRDNDIDGDGTPNDSDTDNDNDGLSDSFEIANGLEPFDPLDIYDDADNDGLTNLQESQLGTDINNEDSDGDGVRDGADTYPLNDKRWTDTDTDGDGVTDDVETLLGLDINSRLDVWQDADNDGRPLYYERLLNSDESVKDNEVFSKTDESVKNLVRLAYVDAQYLFVDDNTLASLVSQLNNGDTNIALLYSDLLTDFHLAQMGFIGRVYKAVMMRNADAGGAAHYRKRLNTGMSRLAVVTGFVNSNEFQNRYGSLSNGEFVELVYRNVMNRQADAGGYNYWLGRLDSGASSRADMMLGFVESNEYINRIDKLERMRVLSLLITRHQYSDDELNAFVARMDAEQSAYSVMRELLASDKFKTRVMTGLTPASDDTDGDGVIDGIEFIDGTDAQIKDNDVESNDTAFVKQSYRDLLTEQWSLTQVANDVTLLATQTRSQWLDSLMNSDAYVDNQTPVARLFFSAFLRRPDRNGLRFWQGKFDDGMKLKDIANVFAGSGEFQNRYGSLTDSEFIDLAYQNVLLRNVDAGGKQFWLNKLSNGTSRGEMLSGFSDSNEGKRKAQSKVNSVLLYNDLLQRDPSNGEYSSAKTQLDNNDREGLITTLLNMQEYSLRFN